MGREWELNTIVGLLDQSIDGKGRVVGLVGPPGIGKSRMVVEVTLDGGGAGCRGVHDVLRVAYQGRAVSRRTRLLRNLFAIGDLDADAARANIRRVMQDADPEDLLLLEDLLGHP